MDSDWIKSWKQKLEGRTKIILILGFAGILLIFLSGYLKEEDAPSVQEDSFSLESYISGTQHSLEKIVSSITGEENPVVMITAESSVRQVYATEKKSSGGEELKESEENYVLVKGTGGTQNPVKIMEVQPEIKGVVVVSKYADNFTVKEKIIDAVRTALDLSSSQVCVVSSQKQ